MVGSISLAPRLPRSNASTDADVHAILPSLSQHKISSDSLLFSLAHALGSQVVVRECWSREAGVRTNAPPVAAEGYATPASRHVGAQADERVSLPRVGAYDRKKQENTGNHRPTRSLQRSHCGCK